MNEQFRFVEYGIPGRCQIVWPNMFPSGGEAMVILGLESERKLGKQWLCCISAEGLTVDELQMRILRAIDNFDSKRGWKHVDWSANERLMVTDEGREAWQTQGTFSEKMRQVFEEHRIS